MTTVSSSRNPLARRLAGIGRGVHTIRATLRNPLKGVPPEVFHAPVARKQMFRRDLVYLADPALIHEALVTRADHLDKGEVVQRLLRPALGNGLLTAEGADWLWQRRAIAPVFRAGGLGRFQPAMRRAAEACRDRLLALPEGNAVAVNEEMMQVTFDIIVETMLSGADAIDVEATAAAVSDYLRNTRWANLASMLGVPEWAPHPGKRRTRRAGALLRAQLMGAVAARRAAVGGGGGAPRRRRGARRPGGRAAAGGGPRKRTADERRGDRR